MFFPFRELGNVIGAEGVAVVVVEEEDVVVVVELLEPVGATVTAGIDRAAAVEEEEEVFKEAVVVGVVFEAPNKPVVAGVVVVVVVAMVAGALEGIPAAEGAAGKTVGAAAAVLEPNESADGGVIGLAAVAAPKLKEAGLLALEDAVVVAGVVGLKENVGGVAGLAAEADPKRVEVGAGAGVGEAPEPKVAVLVVAVVGAAPKAVVLVLVLVLMAGLALKAGVEVVLKLKPVVPTLPEPNVAVLGVAAAGFAAEPKELEPNAGAGVAVVPKAGLAPVGAEPKVTAGALELVLEEEPNAVGVVGAAPLAAPEEVPNDEEPKANVEGVPEEPNALGVAFVPEEVPNEVLPKAPVVPLAPKAEVVGVVPELAPKGVGGLESSFFFSPPKPLPNI